MIEALISLAMAILAAAMAFGVMLLLWAIGEAIAWMKERRHGARR